LGETLTFEVGGLHCASCVGRAEKALQAMAGVEQVNVNLATNKATVSHSGGLLPADFATAIEGAGYTASFEESDLKLRREAEAEDSKRLALTAGALALPVVFLAMGPHIFPSLHHVLMQFPGIWAATFIQFVLTTVVLAWPGRVFFERGFPALWRMAPDMNSLVAIGTLAAWAYSCVALFAPNILPEGSREVYFEAAAVIVTLILLGRYLEARAKGRTGAAIQGLLELQPDVAWVERDGVDVEVPFAEIVLGDVVLIKPGSRIPVDGAVVSGNSFVDESMISGEPVPVEKTVHAGLVAGTVNGTGVLRMVATAVGSDTTLARIIKLVEDVQGGKLPIQAVVDRVTFVFVPIVLGIAAITILAWFIFGGNPSLALVAGVSVLIIACPCAMGLATPTSVMVGSGRAARSGVLFRKGDALQRLQDVRVVALDKTGTLTEGRPRLTTLDALDGFKRDEVLQLVASVEQSSEHPIARAIVDGAEGLALAAVENFRSDTGFGVSGTVAGREVSVGAARYLRKLSVAVPEKDLAALEASGQTAFLAAIDGQPAALIGVSDPIKEGSLGAVRALQELGLKVAMVTGDGQITADTVAKELGVDTVIAEVLPDGKTEAVAQLREQFGLVGFVGDGINDAPALAAADVGVAIGTGTDIAIEAADVVLMSGDVNGVVRAFSLSQSVMRNIRQNLFWAFAYNTALIPIAAGVLYPAFGLLLSPILASAAMGLSSVFVLSNALRLNRA
jgi:heavy metal translocating P-type ATPase